MAFTIHTIDDLAAMTRRYGILPFFKNRVTGWSVAEMCDPKVWFTAEKGPWEWKGPLAADKSCVYGKFLRGKAAFVAPEWFRELSHWRRDGYDWAARVEEGLAPRRDCQLMEYLETHPMSLSKHARRECGFDAGYDAVLTRLQMQTYVVTADFQYDVSRDGTPYGWGNAVIIRADQWLDDMETAPGTPEASLERIVSHLMSVLPDADEAALRREIR